MTSSCRTKLWGRLVSFVDRFAHRRRKGGGVRGVLSLASVATGHSLVAPCGLGNNTEAGGVSHGVQDPPSLSNSSCNRAGRRKLPACGRAFIIGMCEGLSVKEHMCPCKQDGGGWSPSSGQDCLYPSLNTYNKCVALIYSQVQTSKH